MKNLIFILISFYTLLNTEILNAQIYDGAQNKVSYLGTEISNYNHIIFGTDVGLTDFLSCGVNLKFNLNPPANAPDINIITRTTGEIRLDFHGANILNLKKSDILLGYGLTLDILHGPHINYQYFFTDFFGLYSRATYNIKTSSNNNRFYEYRKQDPLSFEFGIAYKFFNTYF